MKKKVLSLVTGAALLLTAVCGLFAGCKPPDGNKIIIDKTKKQIYFQVFNGGFGSEWAFRAALAFNETDAAYQVVPAANKDEYYVIHAGFEAGTQANDIFLNVPDFREGFAKGWFEDLTDVYNSRPDGEDKPMLKDKIFEKDRAYVDSYFKVGGGYYGVPFSEGISGFIYDHGVFLEKGLLIGESGSLITSPSATLSAGRDGQKGTFDDGHPVNLQEYELMLSKILGANMSPFLWTSQFGYYINPLFETLHAEYDGLEAYNLQYNFEGTYTKPSTGVQTPINKTNGYLAFAQEGKLEALKFVSNYLGQTIYYHDAVARSTSHTDAQQIFVYSAAEQTSVNKQAAFLYEGNWWENEARARFNSLAERGRTDYAYGTRDYRMMMLPRLNTYQEDKGYFLDSIENMCIFAKKQADPDKAAAVKRFISFLCSDKQLSESTALAGFLRPFNYSISPADDAVMTKFGKNCFELRRADNVAIMRSRQREQTSDVAYAAYGAGAARWTSGGMTQPVTVLTQNKNTGLAPVSAQTYYNGIQTHNQAVWPDFLAAANA